MKIGIKIVIIILLIGLMFVIIRFLPLIQLIIFDRNMSQDNIISKFNNNIEIFNKVIGELSTEENIYITKGTNFPEISIHQHDENGKANIIKVGKESFDKYSNALTLIKQLNILDIDKDYNNITFWFNQGMRNTQCIVYLKDLEKYEWSGHKIRDKKQIQDDWYYVELDW